MSANALDTTGWGATARPDELLRRALVDRQKAGPLERSVSVTELLDPRAAYWRRVRPVPASPERAARMRAGQEMHVRAGHVLAPASAREVRRRREGIVARIDLLDERVTELKTTSLRSGAEGAAVRPSYLQQLAIYCGLLERSEARLILIDPTSEGGPRAEAYDAEFPAADVAWAEALRRATALRAALERGTPDALPRCVWRDRGCEFQAAGVCDCQGTEPEAALDAFGPLPKVAPVPDVAGRLVDGLTPQSEAPGIRRFRDLLYPRRAYFDRTMPPDEAEREWTPPAGGGTEDLWRTLSDLLESGVAGEVAAVDAPDGEPLERVTTLAGRPLLLKTNRSWNPPAEERVVTDQPQVHPGARPEVRRPRRAGGFAGGRV